MRVIAIALMTGLLAAAPIEAQTYTFTGLCTDCAGTVTATLTLDDYTPGDALSSANLVSFSYGSNLIPDFTITSAYSLSGAFAASGAQLADIDIRTNDIPARGGMYEFVSHMDGNWTVSFQSDESSGSDFLDIGTQGTWSVPEPASWALMISGMGFVGCALRGRRKSIVNFA